MIIEGRFLVSLRGNLSFEERLSAANFDAVLNYDFLGYPPCYCPIDEGTFPIMDRCMGLEIVHIVRFPSTMFDRYQIEREMAKEGLRPATHELAFDLAAQHPQVQIRFMRIAFLGSGYVDRSETIYYCLSLKRANTSSERGCGPVVVADEYFHKEWESNWYFAAVRS